MDGVLVSELNVKLDQTLADVIIKNQFMILTINSLHHSKPSEQITD